MRVLHIVAGYPSSEKPYVHPFIKAQIDSLKYIGVEVDVFNINSVKSSHYYLKSVSEIKKILKEGKHDIIHAHYTYCGLTAYLVHPEIPLVLSLMGSDLLGDRNLEGKLTLRGKFDRSLTNYLVKRVNYIIVKSIRMKEFLKTQLPVSIVPNGIDFKLFMPSPKNLMRKKMNINEKDFIILFLGNPKSAVKNFKLTKDAVEYFKNNYPFDNISLLTPFGINQEKVVNYMNAADVLLLTSFFEGSPNVIKEAMACNLPIITTDVGDVKEIINGSNNCFIVSYSEKTISEKLKIIYNNRDRSNGREKIQHLRSDIVALKVKEIYNTLIKNQQN